jgi:TPR repeat protein
MNQPFALVGVGAAIFSALLFTGCGKSAPTPASAGDELTTLREEVAALRGEVRSLRNEISVLKYRGAAWEASSGKPPSALAEMQQQSQAPRTQLASNLVQIAVDRGGEAWKRGDYKEAMKLLTPLAESGHPIAQHRVGVMYVLGQGVPRDFDEAIKWFTRSAEQGQGESQHSLGLRYLWGEGVGQNPKAAAAWFQAAANQGIPDSATWLGDMYWNGNGVKQDVVEGYKWLLLAGDKYNINHCGRKLEQYAAQLTPQQKAEAEQRARDFVPHRIGPADF